MYNISLRRLSSVYRSSQTCIRRPPLGQRKCGLLRQVTA